MPTCILLCLLSLQLPRVWQGLLFSDAPKDEVTMYAGLGTDCKSLLVGLETTLQQKVAKLLSSYKLSVIAVGGIGSVFH